MNLSEFLNLSRDDRNERIWHAEDTNTCSICEKPILEGEPRNGLYHSHYDCADTGPVPTAEDIGKAVGRCERALDNLRDALKRR